VHHAISTHPTCTRLRDSIERFGVNVVCHELNNVQSTRRGNIQYTGIRLQSCDSLHAIKGKRLRCSREGHYRYTAALYQMRADCKLPFRYQNAHPHSPTPRSVNQLFSEWLKWHSHCKDHSVNYISHGTTSTKSRFLPFACCTQCTAHTAHGDTIKHNGRRVATPRTDRSVPSKRSFFWPTSNGISIISAVFAQ